MHLRLSQTPFFRLLVLLVLTNPLFGLIYPPHHLNQRNENTGSVQRKYLTEKASDECITSLLIWVSFDGGRFTGWSASNREGGFVRSVEAVIQEKMAKIFGDVDRSRIVVEGTSRTDKGVHAIKMVAQTYCLSTDFESQGKTAIPGKRLPHPTSSHDTSSFVTFPMRPAKFMFVLNRMFPEDVSIRAVCPSPHRIGRPFHPTLDAVTKTYKYTLSVGPVPDPTQWRWVWHIGSHFDSSEMQSVCTLLHGTHDFKAFRGAPRGKNDRRKQKNESTICTLSDICFREEESGSLPELRTFTVTVTGDRFLYKMVRFIVGCLVEVGQGKLGISSVERALKVGCFDWDRKPVCAPGNGLVLADMDHSGEIDWLT